MIQHHPLQTVPLIFLILCVLVNKVEVVFEFYNKIRCFIIDNNGPIHTVPLIFLFFMYSCD
jgi:hypothetical protein